MTVIFSNFSTAFYLLDDQLGVFYFHVFAEQHFGSRKRNFVYTEVSKNKSNSRSLTQHFQVVGLESLL